MPTKPRAIVVLETLGKVYTKVINDLEQQIEALKLQRLTYIDLMQHMEDLLAQESGRKKGTKKEA